jgi:hypothetical protein
MSLLKIAQNAALPSFCQNEYITFLVGICSKRKIGLLLFFSLELSSKVPRVSGANLSNKAFATSTLQHVLIFLIPISFSGQMRTDITAKAVYNLSEQLGGYVDDTEEVRFRCQFLQKFRQISIAIFFPQKII